MKRLLSLSLFLMTAMLSFAHDFESGGIYYNITSSTAPYTVAVTYQGTSSSEYKNEYTGSVTIPEKVTYNGKTYSVTSIREFAFEDCSGLTSVEIPNSVTSIGDYAFAYCSGLTSITIPGSVTSIGGSAFEGCSGLKKVIVPDIAAWCNISFGSYSANPLCYAKHIYSDENNEITDLVIPNSVTSIGGSAFSGCSGLTSVTIGNSVTSIGSNAFGSCSGLTSITIPNSVTSIGSSAFLGCSGLTSVTIPNSVTTIGNAAFWGCSSLTSVSIGNSVTSIGGYAFYYCSGLTSVTIPNSVTSIGSYAFGGCSGLTSVTIPNSVTNIGADAFFGTAWYTAWYNNQPEGLIYLGKVAYKYKGTMPKNTVIDLEEGTTEIAGGAFYNCSGLISITIPNSVTSIGSQAFYGCI